MDVRVQMIITHAEQVHSMFLNIIKWQCPNQELPYTLKFLKGNNFVVSSNSAQKEIFMMDKICVIKLPAMRYSCYELEISQEKFLWPCSVCKICENFQF